MNTLKTNTLKIVNPNEINSVGNLSPKELLRTVKRMYNAGLLMQAFAVKTAIDNELHLSGTYLNEADFVKREFDLEFQRYYELKKIGEVFEDIYSANHFFPTNYSARAESQETEDVKFEEIENLGKHRIIALSALGKENINKIFNSGETNINGKKLSLEDVKTIPAHDLRKYITSLLEEPADKKGNGKGNTVNQKTLTEQKYKIMKAFDAATTAVDKSSLDEQAKKAWFHIVVQYLEFKKTFLSK